MPLGTYDTATMLEALDATPRPRTFIRERLFGGNTETFDTEYVMADFKKGKRNMAPFVSRYIGGQLVEKSQTTTKFYTPPMLAPRAIFRGDEALKRGFGEVVGGGENTPEDRMAKLLASGLTEHDMLITRREEWMLAKMLATGVIEVVGEGVKDEINLNFTNTETLSGDDLWSASTADPIGNIRAWKRVVLQKSGITPDTLLLGAGAVDALIKHEPVQKLLNIINVNVGRIEIRDLPNGATYVGTIEGVDIFEYSDWYIDDTTGTEKPMVADDIAILFPSASRVPSSKMLYGGYFDVEDEVMYRGDRIPRNWTEKGVNQRYLEVVSFPLPFVQDVDSWLVADVLT